MTTVEALDLDGPEVRKLVEDNLRKLYQMDGGQRRKEMATNFGARDDIECAKQFFVGFMTMAEHESAGSANWTVSVLATLAIMVHDIRHGERLKAGRQ